MTNGKHALMRIIRANEIKELAATSQQCIERLNIVWKWKSS